MEYTTLNNGVQMPMAGIGTFLLSPDEAEASVRSALQCGYRLIDTANAYMNEKAVGRAIRSSGLPRQEIFLETKLWPSFYEQPDAVDKTLQRLGADYVDLLLIHQPAGNYLAGYRQMEKAIRRARSAPSACPTSARPRSRRSWTTAKSAPPCCRPRSTPTTRKKPSSSSWPSRPWSSRHGTPWATGTRP